MNVCTNKTLIKRIFIIYNDPKERLHYIFYKKCIKFNKKRIYIK